MAGNPFTSAQAPAPMQMVAPDLAAQQTQLTRQQQLADMLRQNAMESDQGTQVINGWAVRKSPFEAVGQLASALMAKSNQDKIDEKQIALGKALQGRMSDAFDAMAGGGARTPGAGSPPPAGSGAGAGQSPPAQPPQPSGVPGAPMKLEDAVGAPASAATAPTEYAGEPTPSAPPSPGPSAPSVPSAAAASSGPQMTQADRIRAQAKAAYLMGNTELANKLLENLSTLTDQQKNDAYFGITSDQARDLELGKRKKEGYIPPTSLRGQAYTTADGQIHTLPDAAQPGYMNKYDQATGQWSTVPIQGGVASVQESEKAKTLGKTLGTIGQGVDETTGKPAYFLGVPPGTVGAPQGAQPSAQQAPSPAPASPQINLSNMTPQEREKVMSDARAIGYLRPGSGPGTSLPGPATGAPPTQVAPRSSTGVIRPGNAPGQNEFMTTQATAAGKRINDLVSAASDSPTRVNVLDNIINLSKSGVNSGPNAEWTNMVKGYVSGVPGFGGWKDDVAGYQELKKYMNQNGLRAWQAAGGSGTDSQLSAAMAANPNSEMFPQALQDVAKWAKAGELALQSKANAAQASAIRTPEDQVKFESAWRQNMDPRIYQMRLMAPTEAKAFVESLKKSDPSGYQDLLKKAQALKQMGGL